MLGMFAFLLLVSSGQSAPAPEDQQLAKEEQKIIERSDDILGLTDQDVEEERSAVKNDDELNEIEADEERGAQDKVEDKSAVQESGIVEDRRPPPGMISQCKYYKKVPCPVKIYGRWLCCNYRRGRYSL